MPQASWSTRARCWWRSKLRSLLCVLLVCGATQAHAIEEPEVWSTGDYAGAVATGVGSTLLCGFGGLLLGVATADGDGLAAIGVVALTTVAGATVGSVAGPHIYANVLDRPKGNSWAGLGGFAGGLAVSIGFLLLALETDSTSFQLATAGLFVVLPTAGAAVGYGLTAERPSIKGVSFNPPVPTMLSDGQQTVFGLQLLSGHF